MINIAEKAGLNKKEEKYYLIHLIFSNIYFQVYHRKRTSKQCLIIYYCKLISISFNPFILSLPLNKP